MAWRRIGARSIHRRAAAAALVLVVGVAACSYSRDEPGLFGDRSQPPTPRSSTDSSTDSGTDSRPPVEPTNPRLPVLGERIWTTGDGRAITVRFAVHSVRRMVGATILDWSVTPLAGAHLLPGDDVPPTVDLGLGREDNGDQRIYLVDADHRVYRPLTHRDPDVFRHCLCTPLWVAQLHLRMGQTQMLQIAFAPLPAEVDRVDVLLANSIPFWHVPVLAEGLVPLAARSVDLARPADALPALSGRQSFTRAVDPPGRPRALGLLDLQTGSSGTTLIWSLWSLDDSSLRILGSVGPPVSAWYGDPTGVRSENVASGPELRLADGTRLRARWITSDEPEPGYLECLCSHFGLWAAGLRTAGGGASVSTTFAGLPAGTRRVDVVLPGVGTIHDVPVRDWASDPDQAMLGVGRMIVETWTYSMWNPPGGWSTSAWPTPLPDPAQLRDYRARVDRLVDLVPA